MAAVKNFGNDTNGSPGITFSGLLNEFVLACPICVAAGTIH
jgi:hypothetical protein